MSVTGKNLQQFGLDLHLVPFQNGPMACVDADMQRSWKCVFLMCLEGQNPDREFLSAYVKLIVRYLSRFNSHNRHELE